jgi:hypothetical protein
MPRPTLLSPALATLLCACTAHDLAAPNPMPEQQTDTYATVTQTRQADILFVVDNSLSMKQEQDNLARNFPAFIDELRKIRGGLPDVHIGVVTTDVGAGTLNESGCMPGGQNGRFQGWDKNCGLEPNSRFIAAAEGEQKRNYQGDLSGVFGCMTQVGTNGCGYEHQLEAMKRALSVQSGSENGPFLREKAYLQIVIITDEDDCSAPSDSALFNMSLPGEEASFRCARAGHTCRGQAIPTGDFTAPLSECKPSEDGTLTRVGEFVSAIRAIKEDPNLVYVAGIFGWPTDGAATYRVGKSDTGRWDYLPACQSANGEATAGLRMKEFIDSFQPNSVFESICAGDFRPALAKIGAVLAKGIDGDRYCVAAPAIDTSTAAGVQADCVVGEEPIGKTGEITYLPRCDSSKGVACWKVEAPGATCPDSGFDVVIERNGQPAAPDRQVSIKCRTCTKADDPRCHR